MGVLVALLDGPVPDLGLRAGGRGTCEKSGKQCRNEKYPVHVGQPPPLLPRNDIVFGEQFEDAFGDKDLPLGIPVAANAAARIDGGTIERGESNPAALQIAGERVVAALDRDEEFGSVAFDEFA